MTTQTSWDTVRAEIGVSAPCRELTTALGGGSSIAERAVRRTAAPVVCSGPGVSAPPIFERRASASSVTVDRNRVAGFVLVHRRQR